MADYDSVQIVNGIHGLESRTNKSGRQRFTIRIEAEPVFVVTDPKMLGATVAQGIAHHLRERVLAISATAAPRTLKARKVAAQAFADGKQWATKRYAGGRTGPTPPNQTQQAFNDSGRFAKTIRASASKDGAWRVDVAANRLDARTGNIARIWSRLLELVPDFADIGKIMRDNQLLARTVQQMIKKGRMTSKPATALDAIKATLDVLKTARDILAA